MIFLLAMKEDSYWNDFVSTIFDYRNSVSRTNISNLGQQDRSYRGRRTENSMQNNNEELSPLHKAARFEDVGVVKSLIAAEVGKEIVQVNPHGYTPLHAAAMAINPNAEIAKLLIGYDAEKRWLNAQTDAYLGRNTALHLAAANVNVTKEFIEEFKKAESKCRNTDTDTPYHIAAKSGNREAIIYMLNTFAPTNKGWDIDTVESHEINTVINICARNGNAKAVALLIKHGADISQGVLHEVILESVKNAKKIQKLLSVYQAIVDNAVTWHSLENESEIPKFKGSRDYLELFRKIMIWLLTKPLENYNNKNVIQFALDHGAHAMFWQIINTKSVFRMDYMEKAGAIQGHAMKNLETGYWTVFDVTNFTEETILPSNSDQKKVDPVNASENTPLCCISKSGVECAEDGMGARNPNEVQSKRILERKFEGLKPPSKPYLTDLLLAFDHWRSSNVLNTQPLKDLSEPYITLVQRFYSILGLVQLLFMICFTAFHLPTTCSLARMFSVSNAPCNSSSNVTSDNTVLSIFSHHRSWTAAVWLIWPSILFAMLVFITFHYVEQVALASEKQSKRFVFKSKDLRLSFRRKFLESLLQLLLPTSFCLVMFLWFLIYVLSESYEYYVDVTGMVLLFGWIANLYFFGAVSKNFSVFSLVVSQIIQKDVTSFMLFFGFNVLAYSYAMHALRVSLCSPNEFMDETFFSVLSSAFGMGDLYEDKMHDSTCARASLRYLFEITYFLYVCATMIILLNVLIAMLNHRYVKAKAKSEIIWRFQMLSVMRAFERHELLARIMKKCLMPIRTDESLFRPKPTDSTIKLMPNRWYLGVVLPVDEQITTHNDKDATRTDMMI